MEPAPRVSAVIPVRDRAGLVGRAIESALSQRDASFEVIVVDDGSRDATSRVLDGYGDRIRRVRLDPQGRSAARNAGIARARGEFVAFLDSDDAWLDAKLSVQLAWHDANPEVGMSAHGVRVVAPDGRETQRPARADPRALREAPYAAIPESFAFVPSAVLVRTELARAVGGFDPAYPVAEDLDFALRVARRAPVGVLEACLVRRFLHPGQSGRGRVAAGNARVLRDHLEREPLDPATRAALRRRIARYLVSAARRESAPEERARLLADAVAADARVRWRRAYWRARASRRPRSEPKASEVGS